MASPARTTPARATTSEQSAADAACHRRRPAPIRTMAPTPIRFGPARSWLRERRQPRQGGGPLPVRTGCWRSTVVPGSGKTGRWSHLRRSRPTRREAWSRAARPQPGHARPGGGGLAQRLASRVAPLVVPVRLVPRRAEAVPGGVDNKTRARQGDRRVPVPLIALPGRPAVGEVDREALGVLDAGAQEPLGHLPGAPPAGVPGVQVDVLAGAGEPPDRVLEQDRPPGVKQSAATASGSTTTAARVEPSWSTSQSI
jgi:hypothetical protein